MKYLDENEIATINELMYNKALDVDVALYNFEFDYSTPEFCETSLYLYQNPDGGFGHDLSLDNLNPNSTVFETYEAFKVFKSCAVYDGNNDDISKELIFGAMKWLWSQESFSVSDPSNEKYACAKRFKGEPKNDLMLGIVGYTLLFCPKGSKYYKKALEMAQNNLESIMNTQDYDYLTLEQFKIFLIACVMKQEFTDKFEFMQAHFNGLLKKFLDASDPNLDYFEILGILEDFELSKEETEVLNKTLDILVDERKKHGMWENNKKWGTEDIYPEAMSSELKWLGRSTRLAIHYLKKYNRIK